MRTHVYVFIVGVILLSGLFSEGFSVYTQVACLGQELNEPAAESLVRDDLLDRYLGKQTGGNTLVDLLVFDQYADDTLDNQKPASTLRTNIIFEYCDTVLGERTDQNLSWGCFENSTFRYDSRQSLFVYSLCVNMSDKASGLTIANESIRDREYRNPFANLSYLRASPGGTSSTPGVDLNSLVVDELDLNEIRGLPAQEKLDTERAYHDCNPKTSMQACHFSDFAPAIFHHIMNAYSNMKLATIYGYKYVDQNASKEEQEQQRRKAIEEFSRSYFAPPNVDGSYEKSGNDNECNESGRYYLQDNDAKGDKKHCQHPKTYAIMDETIKSAQVLLKNIDTLKAQEIIAQPCDDKTTGNAGDGYMHKDNLMACAFSNHGDTSLNNDMGVFNNLLLNELMWYNLFIEYYIQQLQRSPNYVGSEGNESQQLIRQLEEIDMLRIESELAQQATKQMMRQLDQVYTTFPVHIALMAYLEDVVLYRKKLARLYTPLHQLYYLWRNAQSCQR